MAQNHGLAISPLRRACPPWAGEPRQDLLAPAVYGLYKGECSKEVLACQPRIIIAPPVESAPLH